MAQSLCNICNVIPIVKSSSTNGIYGQCYFHPKRSPEIGLIRIRSNNNKNGVQAMKAERRDNLDHLQRPGLKKRDVTSTPLGLWDRFPTAKTVQQMMETMDRMMDDPTAYTTRWPSPLPNDGNGYVKGRTPWEIKEGEGEYKLRFDMPGMTKNDVKLWVEQNMLVIKAEKVAKQKDGQENGVVVEEDEGDDWSHRSYGTYSSRIALPENVEFEKIKAEVRDGVLYITIPKPVSKTRVFDIDVA